MRKTKYEVNNNWIVYLHTVPNNKVYVGITQNKKNRWRSYGKEYERNVFFSTDIRKYGWINIKHDVLEKNLSYEEACMLEREYINRYSSYDSKYGYNLTYGGKGVDGVEAVTNRIEVTIYDSNGASRDFKSIKECADFLEVSHGGVTFALRNKKGYDIIKGYVVKKKNENIDIAQFKNNNEKPILQLDNDFKIIKRWGSRREAGYYFGCDSSIFYKAYQKGIRVHGFYWCIPDKYETFVQHKRCNGKRVCQYDLNGNYIKTFVSGMDAARKIGKNNSTLIHKVCRNKKGTAYGYIWRYECDEIYP